MGAENRYGRTNSSQPSEIGFPDRLDYLVAIKEARWSKHHKYDSHFNTVLPNWKFTTVPESSRVSDLITWAFIYE